MAHVLTEMSWPAVETALQETRLIVVPTASIEQHGPHLPLAVDTLRAEELGQRVADRLQCFLAPTIRPGMSAHHMPFPGTISLREETFREVLHDYCMSLATHGFEEIALFTSHGGNADTLEEFAPELDTALDTHVFVAGTRDGMMAARTDAMAEFGVSPEAAGAHAGAAETAFILHTNPTLVADCQQTTGFVGDLAETEASIEDGINAISENGVLGDPEQAIPDQGEGLIENTAQYLAVEVRRGIGSSPDVGSSLE